MFRTPHETSRHDQTDDSEMTLKMKEREKLFQEKIKQRAFEQMQMHPLQNSEDVNHFPSQGIESLPGRNNTRKELQYFVK
jgi:hypothetical protein